MTQHFVESSIVQPQLIVFQQSFVNTKSDNSETILKSFEEDFESKQLCNWTAFWEDQGEAIIVEEWKVKYHSYLNEATEVNSEATTESEQLEALVADTQEVLDQAAGSQNNTDGWQELWQQHVEEVYAEQYILYSSVYYNYYLELKRALHPQAPDLSVLAEDQVASKESQEDLAAELEQLELLGLPLAFGRRKQRSKKSRNTENQTQSSIDQNNLAQYLGVLFSDDDEQGCEEQDDEDCYPLSDMNRTKSEISADADLALHALQNPSPISKSKKRNRKLREVPAFLLEEKGMLKYWRKRFSLFSRFDAGIRLDRESWFSVTPEKVALHLAERLRCDTLVDGFCGCGGNTIQFAKTCRQVIAIDIDPVKLEMAKHNARIYGVADKIEFILGDFLQLSRSGKLHSDVVFLSPPWGGPKYKKKRDYDIENFLVPVGATELMECGRNISENVALFLPRNSNLQQIIKLAGVGNRCELEHNYLDTRLVALTALYGERILCKET